MMLVWQQKEHQEYKKPLADNFKKFALVNPIGRSNSACMVCNKHDAKAARLWVVIATSPEKLAVKQ